MARRKKSEEKKQQTQLPPDLQTKIQEWQRAQGIVAQWKDYEFALRQAIVAEAFDVKKFEGTETIELGAGFKLKCLKRQDYSATNKQGETATLMQWIGFVAPGIAAGLVDWKPDLSVKVYKELIEKLAEMQAHLNSMAPPNQTAPNLAELLAAAVTIKPGAPSLELIAPEVQVQQ